MCVRDYHEYMSENELSEASSTRNAPVEPYRVQLDTRGDPLEWAIYDEIATVLGLEAQKEEIPLFDQIDPEALQSLFTDDSGDAYVSFPLWDMRIVVRSDGLLEIRPGER